MDSEGQTTDDPAKAVTMEFPFVVRGQVASNISISLADEGTLKLLGSNEVDDNKWFDLIRELHTFAKSNGLQWQPNIQGKDQLQKRNSKDTNMEESSLYGSSKSSYQNMETTKLIIRHSKRIQEGSPNSRTRNIEALYIQNEGGERFRYPFPHLAGARAMQRHVANGGNPYDHFGHYVCSLSEQAYNYRRVNNLLARKSFTENSEIFEIAEKSKKKVKDIKKILERIQKQNGYLLVRENFTTFKKKEMDEATLNELRSTFTTQQFNEELVELFPYISDLMSEERVDEISDKLAKKVQLKRAQQYATADNNPTGGSPEEEKAWHKYTKNTDLMNKRSKKKSNDVDEAKDDVPDEVFFKDPKNAPSADWVAQDAKAKSFPTRQDAAQKQGGLLSKLEQAVQNSPYIEVEPYSKDFIAKAVAITQRQIQQLEAKAQENPRDNQIKWALEKATARMGILQKRLETADAQGPEKNSIAIEHLGKHIKNNDELSNLMLMASDEYNRMGPEEKKKMVQIYRAIVAKQKYVGLFTNESLAYQDLEIILSETAENQNGSYVDSVDPMIEFIKGLKAAIGESDDDDSDDDDSDDQETDEEDMVKPRPDKAEKTGDPQDVVEFVKSLYNADENSFPRGEEGVVISAVKEFGDEAEPIARESIEALKQEGAAHGVAPNADMMRMKQLAGLAPIQNF
jgi:hypothetical protein